MTAVANRLAAALELLLERVDSPPAANCSCHLSPPCNDCVNWGGLREAVEEAEAALAAHDQDERHPDDRAVDAFAIAMKLKLAEARDKGRGGWHDPAQCSAEDLSRMLREHVAKGDPRDVANFCMMLQQRGEAIADGQPVGQEPVAEVIQNPTLHVYIDWRGKTMLDYVGAKLYLAPPKQAVCGNCNGLGVIGYTSGQTPEQFEQGEYPCPECAPAQVVAQQPWQLQLAESLDAFWNPALEAISAASYHGPASGSDVVGAIARGLASVAERLREHERGEVKP